MTTETGATNYKIAFKRGKFYWVSCDGPDGKPREVAKGGDRHPNLCGAEIVRGFGALDAAVRHAESLAGLGGGQR